VASTKELQDDDVLLHTKIESLLQKRLREKRLDALIALQAAWRRKHKAPDEGEVGDDVVAPDVTEAKEAEPAWAAVAAEAIERASAEMEKKGAKVRATQSFDLQLDGQGKVQVHIAKVDVSSMSDVVNRVMAAVRGGGNMASSIDSGGRESEAQDSDEGAEAASEAVATAVGTTDAAEDEAAAHDREGSGGGADEIARTMARMFSEVANVEVANLGDVEVADIVHATTPEAVQEMFGPLLQKMLAGTNQASKNSLDTDAVQDASAEKAEEQELSLEL